MNGISLNSVKPYLPSVQLASPQQMINNVTKIAVPVIALTGAAMMATARADDFTDCIEACDRNGPDAHPLAKLLCYSMCWLIT